MEQPKLLETTSVIGDKTSGLNTVFAKFERVEAFSFKLFDGFQSMRVLTYSASINMILKTVERFEQVECIFGYEGVIGELAYVIAFQKNVSDELLIATKAMEDSRKQRLLAQMQKGRVQFRVTMGAVAHSKIYLLEHPDKKRVIVGSANLSDRAFSGKQAETLLVFDDDQAAWEHYTSEYEAVKQRSSSSIKLPNLTETEVRFEHVPIIEQAQASEAGIEVFINTDVQTVTVPQVIRKVERLVEPIRKFVNSHVKQQNGRIILNHKNVGSIVSLIRSHKHADETQTPDWLSVYLDSGKVLLSGREISLNPNRDAVVSDVGVLIEYFGNFKDGFYGDVEQHQKDYFAFMCWFYFSPFICELRNQAIIEQKYIFDIPSFAVIYGKSNCGKTRLIETLMLSMFGFFQFVDKQYFTRTNLRGLLQSKKRFPVVFDDIDKKQFSAHAPDVIKDETFTLEEYPAFVLSMNAEEHSFPTELVKRCLMFYTQASLPDNDAAAKRLYNSVMAVRKRLTTSLYQEYLRRILENLRLERFPQDILQFSSEILTGIFQEAYPHDLPSWCRVVTIEEYKDKRYGKIKTELLKMYQTNKSIWQVRKDEVILTISSFEVSSIRKDIPDWILKPGSKGGSIVMGRMELEQFLGISFKQSIFQRFFK